MKIFGLFDADFAMTLPFLTGWLWAVGGTGIKQFRRFGVPIAITIYSFGYGLIWWKTLILFCSMLPTISFGPGYGDKYHEKLKWFYWIYLILLGMLWTGCQFILPLNYGEWVPYLILTPITGFIFCLLTFGSQRFNFPAWKWVEGITGFTVGLLAAIILG